jgi:hypothetical protein
MALGKCQEILSYICTSHAIKKKCVSQTEPISMDLVDSTRAVNRSLVLQMGLTAYLAEGSAPRLIDSTINK